jgi:hypothetical protein
LGRKGVGRGNASKEREVDGQLHGECANAVPHILLVWTGFNKYKKKQKVTMPSCTTISLYDHLATGTPNQKHSMETRETQ